MKIRDLEFRPVRGVDCWDIGVIRRDSAEIIVGGPAHLLAMVRSFGLAGGEARAEASCEDSRAAMETLDAIFEGVPDLDLEDPRSTKAVAMATRFCDFIADVWYAKGEPVLDAWGVTGLEGYSSRTAGPNWLKIEGDLLGGIDRFAEDLHRLGFENPVGRDHAEISAIVAGKVMAEIAADGSPVMLAMKRINERRAVAAGNAASRAFPEMCEAFLATSPGPGLKDGDQPRWEFPTPW